MRKRRILDRVWRACRRQDGDLAHQPALGLRYEPAHIRVGQRLPQMPQLGLERRRRPARRRERRVVSTPSMTPRACGSASAMVARRRRSGSTATLCVSSTHLLLGGGCEPVRGRPGDRIASGLGSAGRFRWMRRRHDSRREARGEWWRFRAARRWSAAAGTASMHVVSLNEQRHRAAGDRRDFRLGICSQHAVGRSGGLLPFLDGSSALGNDSGLRWAVG